MPFQIMRPNKPLEYVANILPSKANELTYEEASMARDVLRSYTPNRWKKLLYAAVSNMAAIPNGYGVGGPVGRGGLLPEPAAAPKDTIAQFLMAHPKFASRNRGFDPVKPSYHPKGKPFPMAWWYLPLEARELLRDERKAGMYQSGAPAAPYWLIAEEGMTKVGVPARYYLQNSRASVTRGEPLVRKRVMGTI